MEVKIKKLCETAVIPSYAKPGDAGMDLVATSRIFDKYGNVEYGTGLAMEIPEGYVGLLFPRSSIYKKSLAQTNSVGVIDSGYRAEIMAVFKTTTDVVPAVYKEGEKFCQLVIVPIPNIEVEEATELSESERGTNGYGSSDSQANPQEENKDAEVASEVVE